MMKDTIKSRIEYYVRGGVDERVIARMVKRNIEYVRSVKSKLKAVGGKRARNVG